MSIQKKNRSISLPADKSAFTRLRIWLEDIFEKEGVPLRQARQLLVASDEIFTNVSSYAYPDGGEGRILVSWKYDKIVGEFTLTFTDYGQPFDPLTAPEPDVTIPLNARQTGGLGIFMVRKLIDRVEYRWEESSNVLTLVKKIPHDEKAGETSKK